MSCPAGGRLLIELEAAVTGKHYWRKRVSIAVTDIQIHRHRHGSSSK